MEDVFDDPSESDVVEIPQNPKNGSASSQTSENAKGSETAPSSASSEEGDADVISPYVAFQKKVRNRVSRYRRQNFWLVCLSGVLVACLAVSVIANVQLSLSNRVEPFYVAVDEEEGEVMRAGTTTQMQSLSTPLITSKIEEIIRGLRVVYADERATSKQYETAWNYISPESEAEIFLRSQFQLNTSEKPSIAPPALVGSVQRTIIEIDVSSIQGTNSYNVQWIEREIIQQSGELIEKAYTASISTKRVEQNNKELLRKNPLGLYIQGLDWQETSTEIVRSGSGE
jgi:type IV secretion system protein VirB5